MDPNDRCPNTPRGTKVDEIGCFVGVSLKLNFGYDSAVLTAEDQAELDATLGAMKTRPADIVSDFVFEVAGHTDSRGSDAYNQKLSERRAKAARDYLIAGGISADQLVATGYGESMPVADNATDEGRAETTLAEAGGSVKLAIVMLVGDLPRARAEAVLTLARGRLHRALAQLGQKSAL